MKGREREGGREDKQTNQNIFVHEGDRLEWRVFMAPRKLKATLTLFVVVLNNFKQTWWKGKVHETLAE